MIPNGLCVEHVLQVPDRITIFVRPRHSSVACPRCHAPSSRVHSRYERRLADLPWQGQPVIVRLQARRFLCREASCPKRTFAEHPPGAPCASATFSGTLPLPSAAKPASGSSSVSPCQSLPTASFSSPPRRRPVASGAAGGSGRGAKAITTGPSWSTSSAAT